MPYILAIVIVAIAVVLGIFTGVWGGLLWIVAVGIVGAAIVAFGARNRMLDTTSVKPTGTPRGGPPSPGTANRRVGHG